VIAAIIVALIAAGASIAAALIGHSTKKSNSLDHAMVRDALLGLRGDVQEVRGMIWEHVTDRSAHFYVPNGALYAPVPNDRSNPHAQVPIARETPTSQDSETHV
jgi:hypothetical protein